MIDQVNIDHGPNRTKQIYNSLLTPPHYSLPDFAIGLSTILEGSLLDGIKSEDLFLYTKLYSMIACIV